MTRQTAKLSNSQQRTLALIRDNPRKYGGWDAKGYNRASADALEKRGLIAKVPDPDATPGCGPQYVYVAVDAPADDVPMTVADELRTKCQDRARDIRAQAQRLLAHAERLTKTEEESWPLLGSLSHLRDLLHEAECFIAGLDCDEEEIGSRELRRLAMTEAQIGAAIVAGDNAPATGTTEHTNGAETMTSRTTPAILYDLVFSRNEGWYADLYHWTGKDVFPDPPLFKTEREAKAWAERTAAEMESDPERLASVLFTDK